MPSERWMNGYYIGFDPTGCMPVDVILSAVARAGKAYHHTDQWHEECQPYEPDIHRGESCCDWIQNAGEDAAAAFKALQERCGALEEELRLANRGKEAEMAEAVEETTLMALAADKLEKQAAELKQWRTHVSALIEADEMSDSRFHAPGPGANATRALRKMLEEGM